MRILPLIGLILATSVSAETMTWQFHVLYEQKGCADKIVWEWGLEDGKSEYNIQDCRKDFVKSKTFRDRAPRRVYVTFFAAGKETQKGFWDIFYR